VVLNVPSGVDVRKVDLSIELQILAFHAQRRAGTRDGEESDRLLNSLPGGELDLDAAANGGRQLGGRARLTTPAIGPVVADDDYRTGVQAVGT